MKNFKEIGEGELQYSYVAFTKLKKFSEKNEKNLLKVVASGQSMCYY